MEFKKKSLFHFSSHRNASKLALFSVIILFYNPLDSVYLFLILPSSLFLQLPLVGTIKWQHVSISMHFRKTERLLQSADNETNYFLRIPRNKAGEQSQQGMLGNELVHLAMVVALVL